MEIEHFARGKNIGDAKENIYYYVLEYFLSREFKSKDYENYYKYILPRFETENYIHLFLNSYKRNDSNQNTFFGFEEVDISELPDDMYQSNYTEYISEKYKKEIDELLEKIATIASIKPSFYRTVNFDYLNDKYMNNIPREIYITFCSFPKAQNSIIRLSDNNYQVLLNVINKMLEEYTVMDIITKFDIIIGNVESNNLDANDIDYNLFSNILFNSCDINYVFGILPPKNINFFNYYKEGTKEQINSTDRKDLLEAVFILKYGLSLINIQGIFYNADFLLKDDTSEIGIFYREVLEIIQMSDEELKSLYNNTTKTVLKNYYLCKKYVRNKNLELYNQTLTKANGTNVEIELEDDFHIFIHVKGAFVKGDSNNNYCESWNRGQTTSLWMSCSYISNECICTAPINDNGVCYGFNEMEEDSLLYYGTQDLESEIYSYDQSWQSSDSSNILPNEMIDNTGSQNTYANPNYYNEMNFTRKQNGKIKQPDYIILFRSDGKYINEEASRKASADFGNIPILIIDVDKHLSKQEEKFKLLSNKYMETRDENLLKEMYRISNNCYKTCKNWKKTNHFFYSDEIQKFIYFIKKTGSQPDQEDRLSIMSSRKI